jgi:hypothetical protein
LKIGESCPRIDKELLDPLIKEVKKKEAASSNVAPDDPLRVGPPRRPNPAFQDPSFGADPFGYGGADLDPLGGRMGGGGMVFDPPGLRGGRGGGMFPGPRFDPVHPHMPNPMAPGRGRGGGPRGPGMPPGGRYYGDEMPPPGFNDDMFG